jgi:hypothetical protein
LACSPESPVDPSTLSSWEGGDVPSPSPAQLAVGGHLSQSLGVGGTRPRPWGSLGLVAMSWTERQAPTEVYQWLGKTLTGLEPADFATSRLMWASRPLGAFLSEVSSSLSIFPQTAQGICLELRQTRGPDREGSITTCAHRHKATCPKESNQEATNLRFANKCLMLCTQGPWGWVQVGDGKSAPTRRHCHSRGNLGLRRTEDIPPPHNCSAVWVP